MFGTDHDIDAIPVAMAGPRLLIGCAEEPQADFFFLGTGSLDTDGPPPWRANQGNRDMEGRPSSSLFSNFPGCLSFLGL